MLQGEKEKSVRNSHAAEIVTKFFTSREAIHRVDPDALKETHRDNLLQLLLFSAWLPPHQITASFTQNCYLLANSWLAGACLE